MAVDKWMEYVCESCARSDLWILQVSYVCPSIDFSVVFLAFL